MSSHNPPFARDRLPDGVKGPGPDDPDRIGAYEVVGRIGAGGMGAVYAGLTAEGACAAVKVIHPQYATDPEFRSRFAREVDLVSRVRATCAPGFMGADVHASTPWLATEYVPGLTLRQYVRTHGPLTGGVLTALAAGLAEALVAIHAVGVVHRDLKPGNVILAPDGPKVLDFGIARAAEETALTATGGLVGTPGWVAPERYLGQDATGRSDMFAWGGLVAFAATGRDPFGRGAVDAVTHRARHEEPDLDGVPDDLLPLVRRSLAKEEAERPAAEQALAELTEGWNATRVQPVVAEQPTEVVPALLASEWRGMSAPAARRVRRGPHPLVWAGAAVVLVAALVAGLLYVRPGLLPGGGGDEPEPGPGGDGGNTAEDDTLAVESDPENGAAVVSEAVELIESADSGEAVHQFTGVPPANYHTTYRFTSDPEPVRETASQQGPTDHERLEVGEDPDPADFLYRVIPQHDTIAGDAQWFRDPSRDEGYLGGDNFYKDFETVAEADDLTYEGEQEVTSGDEPEVEGMDMDLSGRSGHYYTGTFTEGRAIDAEGAEVEEEVEFGLWIDDEGYPLRYERIMESGGPDEAVPELDIPADAMGEQVFFVQFGEPVEIEVPDESEVGEPPESGIPGGEGAPETEETP
ncbi:serine/threonine protein kinase [Nocardiopsis sp. HNM0947]|uniref:Serine/threonine protein kinase n=1 Tax=Nocardiopsis coralli TaxID=2772213 RepID=A0ABR9P602_9ACTN|nr:serine/threonine-protein kinase [Nocardiopsis coralli]MBE2999279.1 serine/threonine protein kinase [Nocardiopsis coralli]